MTVLFADIKGSTELIQGREGDPELVKALLAPVVRIMRAAAERYGGRVDRAPLGDAIMAVFGAPRALEDHAVRACLAALSLQNGVDRWNESQQQSGATIEYRVRVGLSSGEVVMSDAQLDGPYGEATILASRMETLAPPGKTLMTKSTWLLARGYVRALPLGLRTVAGKKDALEIFQLEGAEARTRFDARERQGLTRFVGREAELDVLSRALLRAAGGEGQVVAITGEPGVGKSRLIHQFLQSGLARQAAVLRASAEPYDRDAVYAPVADLLRSNFGFAPGDNPAAIRAKLEAALSNNPELLPAACALLGVGGADRATEWTDLDAAQRRRRITDAVRYLILDPPRASALILIVEDLQWLDDHTRALVDELVEQVAGRAVLLILTSREPPLLPGAHPQVLELRPLEPLRAQLLLTHLVGEAPGMEHLRQLVLQRADGKPTPLFLEETVSSLAEQGVLAGDSGQFRLRGSLDALDELIPHKVEEVLAARLDRLGREHKEVLDAAAVIGMEAPLNLLGMVTAVDVERLLKILGDLEHADILYESLSSGVSEFRFKHTLTREVAASRMASDLRRRMHARTLAAIESLYGERRGEWIDRLADHAFRAGLPDKAFVYNAEAGHLAVERSANRHAVKVFGRCLAVVEDLPASERPKREIDIRLRLANALLPLGEQDQIARQLLEAKQLAQAMNDPRSLAKIEAQRTLYLWQAGAHEAALQAGETALTLAKADALDNVGLAARLHIGIVHHAFGEFRRSLEWHRSVLDDLAAAGNERRRFNWAAYPAVIARAFGADSLVNLGEFDEAETLLRDGRILTETIGHPLSRTLIETVTGRYHLAQEEPATAVRVLSEAARRCEEDEVQTMLPAVIGVLGVALVRVGRASEALQMLQDAVDAESYRRAGNYTFYYLLMALGEGHWAAGHVDQALSRTREAEQVARRNHERAHLAQALVQLGGILCKLDASAADIPLREALTLAESCGMRPVAAHCWLQLAEIDARLGRATAAHTLETARALLQDLGLARRLERPGAHYLS